MINTKIINRLIDYYLEGSKLTQNEHNTVRSLKEEMQAINYTHCCETLKGKEVISFDLWCDIKNIHHSFDEYYLWDTTLIEYEIVLKMYESFVQNL